MSTPSGGATVERVLHSVGDSITLDFARKLVKLRPDSVVEKRLDELAEKSAAGTLSAEERAEYERLVLAGDFVGILQARARALLADSRPAA